MSQTKFVKAFKKTLLIAVAVAGVYLAIGYLLHAVLFPLDEPDISSYFKPGQTFYSEAEGLRQTVVKHEEGLVYCELVMYPHAPGPPKHIHARFDEHFATTNGTLSVWLDGEVKKVNPGETLQVLRGVPHKPFNETSDTLYLRGTIALPEKFVFGLVQVYGLMDSHPDFGKMPATLFMMAPIQQAGFDSFLAEGPPVVIQRIMSFLLTPASRLMGYKHYYETYDQFLHP